MYVSSGVFPSGDHSAEDLFLRHGNPAGGYTLTYALRGAEGRRHRRGDRGEEGEATALYTPRGVRRGMLLNHKEGGGGGGISGSV